MTGLCASGTGLHLVTKDMYHALQGHTVLSSNPQLVALRIQWLPGGQLSTHMDEEGILAGTMVV